MGLGRYLFLVSIAVALIVYMAVGGYRDLVLLLGSRTVPARITRTHQPPPGRIRDSDIEVWYEYLDESNTVHSGHDILPPAKPPPAHGEILIVHSTRNASLSRIASQQSHKPLSGVCIGISILIMATVRFFRGRGRSEAGDASDRHDE